MVIDIQTNARFLMNTSNEARREYRNSLKAIELQGEEGTDRPNRVDAN